MDSKNNDKKATYMEDEAIVDLYWAREERAISETDRKYRGYLHTIAYNILHNNLDCEECLNDTYLGTWNAIPPTRPKILQAFLSKIMRNTAVVRYKKNTATSRIPSEMTVSLEELEYCIPSDMSVEEEYAVSRLSQLLSRYLQTISEKQAFIFICRYYCCDRVKDIAEMLHVSERTVFRELNTIRDNLRELLVKEGYYRA